MLKAGNITNLLQNFRKGGFRFFSLTACFKQFQHIGKPNYSRYSQKKKLFTLLYTISFVGMQKDMCLTHTCLFFLFKTTYHTAPAKF